uniref:Uncharacterized protein n=1 Tax=Anguilla anguilla TaxID=7936 RepID=A0A0E9Q883_ANGAN
MLLRIRGYVTFEMLYIAAYPALPHVHHCRLNCAVHYKYSFYFLLHL